MIVNRIQLLAISFLSQMVGISATSYDCAKPFDQQFWLFQNAIRTNPIEFVPFVQDVLSTFNGNTYTNVAGEQIQTQEGSSAVNELIDFLQLVPPTHALQWSEPLANAAATLADMQGPTGQTGSTGPDGSSTYDRISEQMTYEATYSENIVYNSMSPLEAVLKLMIDDGVSGRGNRSTVFNSNSYFTGTKTNMHSLYTSETVTTYTGSYSYPSYNSPTITVPQTMAEYTGWTTWAQASACDTSASSDSTTTEEESANTNMIMTFVTLMALFSSMIV